MNQSIVARHQLIDVINNLPSEVLPELANYLSYIQFKIARPAQTEKSASGSSFLLSIAGIGEAEENLSQCDEDILQQEIDPVRGWGLDRKRKP
jgi:hypothetical protein